MNRLVCLLVFLTFSVAGCGGGGGGGSSSGSSATGSSSHSLSVVVTGLEGSVGLESNGEALTISDEGTYSFAQELTAGTSYNILVTSQPSSQTCSVANSSGVIGSDDVDNIFVNCGSLTDNAVILEAAAFSGAVIADSTLTYDSLPDKLATVQAGDVIFAEATTATPDGLLRKVVSVEEVDGKQVITTEGGVLTDLIKSGGFRYKGDITAQWAAENPDGAKISDSTYMSVVTSAANYCDGKESDLVLDFDDSAVSDDISISGCIGLGIELDTGAKASLLGGLDEMHFIVSSVVSAALSVTAENNSVISVEYDILQKALGGKKIKFPAPFPFGVVTIPAYVEFDLFVAIGGGTDSTVTVGAGTALHMTAGARITDTDVQIISDFSPEYDLIGPEIGVGVESGFKLTTAFGPEIAYKIGGVVGPELALSTPYLKLVGEPQSDPWWHVDIGTNATLALTAQLNKVKGFGWLSKKWGFDYQLGEIWDFGFTIAQAEGPYTAANSAPVTGFTTSPSSPQVDSAVTFTNLTSDPDGDILSWYWTFGDGSTSSNENPVHTYTEAGDFDVTLEAIDPDGLSDSLTQTVMVSYEEQPLTWYADSDSDGYGNSTSSLSSLDQPVGYVGNSNDCDDTDDSIYPGATEIYNDGIDQDCDGSDSTVVIDESPDELYHFDDDLTDSLNNTQITFYGDVEYVDGVQGQALRLAQTWGELEQVSFDGFSVSMFVKYEDMSNRSGGSIYTLGTNHHATNSAFRMMVNNDGSIQPAIEAGGSTDAADISDGEWHHVAASFDGSTLVFYFDGELYDSVIVSGTHLFQNVRQAIGNHWWNNYGSNQPRFTGSIDELRVFHGILADTSVQELYQEGGLN